MLLIMREGREPEEGGQSPKCVTWTRLRREGAQALAGHSVVVCYPIVEWPNLSRRDDHIEEVRHALNTLARTPASAVVVFVPTSRTLRETRKLIDEAWGVLVDPMGDQPTEDFQLRGDLPGGVRKHLVDHGMGFFVWEPEPLGAVGCPFMWHPEAPHGYTGPGAWQWPSGGRLVLLPLSPAVQRVPSDELAMIDELLAWLGEGGVQGGWFSGSADGMATSSEAASAADGDRVKWEFRSNAEYVVWGSAKFAYTFNPAQAEALRVMVELLVSGVDAAPSRDIQRHRKLGVLPKEAPPLYEVFRDSPALNQMVCNEGKGARAVWRLVAPPGWEDGDPPTIIEPWDRTSASA